MCLTKIFFKSTLTSECFLFVPRDLFIICSFWYFLTIRIIYFWKFWHLISASIMLGNFDHFHVFWTSNVSATGRFASTTLDQIFGCRKDTQISPISFLSSFLPHQCMIKSRLFSFFYFDLLRLNFYFNFL